MASRGLQLVGVMVNDRVKDLDDDNLRTHALTFMLCAGWKFIENDIMPPIRVFGEGGEIRTAFKKEGCEILRYDIAALDVLLKDALEAEAETNEGAEHVEIELAVGSMPFCFAYIHWLAARENGLHTDSAVWFLRHLQPHHHGDVVFLSIEEGFKETTIGEMYDHAKMLTTKKK